MPNQDPNAIATCGLYCGACFNWVNRHDGDDRLTEPRDPAYQACEGCRSNNLPPQCARCDVRQCAQGLGFATCPKCGAHTSWYQETCGECGSAVSSEPVEGLIAADGESPCEHG